VSALDQALRAMAAAASRKKVAARSFRASPAWSASAGRLSATVPRTSDQGATPNGRPMHQSATRQARSQPRLSSGEKRSRWKASIPMAWKISALAG
jgi:hypothetical protein